MATIEPAHLIASRDYANRKAADARDSAEAIKLFERSAPVEDDSDVVIVEDVDPDVTKIIPLRKLAILLLKCRNAR